MGLRFGWRGAPALFLGLLAGCEGLGARGERDGAGSGGEASETPSLRFEGPSTLRIAPGERTTLFVLAKSNSKVIELSLEGDYEDAALSVAEVIPTSGRADVLLSGPSVPATFVVRARSLGLPDAFLRVAVSSRGYASLSVLASYRGKRDGSSATATVIVGATCAQQEPLGADIAPIAVGAVDGTLSVPFVPAGEQLAVVASVARYAVGCTDVSPREPDTTLSTSVAVYDLPVDLIGIDFAASFAFEPDTEARNAWSSLMDDAIARAADAFADPQASESAALLSAMRSLIAADELANFDAASAAGDWAGKTKAWLTAHPPALKERVRNWMNAGRSDLDGPLGARIVGGAAGSAKLVPELWGTVTASAAGIAPEGSFLWTADSNDSLLLSGTLVAHPSAIAVAVGDGRARGSVAGSSGTATALAAQTDCDGLGTKLQGYAGCSSTCVASLCARGLETMTERARNASLASDERISLRLSASGRANLESTPQPRTFVGAWVGDFTGPSVTLRVKGTAEGQRQ